MLLLSDCCRCRWLRALMLRDALFHDAFRRLPPVLLGVLLLHLPASWQRLEYLAQSGREGSVSVMDAVELEEAAFVAKFPEYPKWKCWNGDQARQVRGVGAVSYCHWFSWPIYSRTLPACCMHVG